MMSQKDFNKIEDLIDKKLEEKLDQKLKFLPTKEHFDARMDTLTVEIQAVREEQTLHQGQHDDIVERLDRVEQKVGLQPL